MRLAVPVSDGRVSSAFDFAHRLLLVECGDGREVDRAELALEEKLPLARARRLEVLEVRVLICGAISRCLAGYLAAAGIDIIPFVTGPVEEVLMGYFSGELESARYLMPGATSTERAEWRMRHPLDQPGDLAGPRTG